MIGNLGLPVTGGQHGHGCSRAIVLLTHELRKIDPEANLVRHRCTAIVAQPEPPYILIRGLENVVGMGIVPRQAMHLEAPNTLGSSAQDVSRGVLGTADVPPASGVQDGIVGHHRRLQSVGLTFADGGPEVDEGRRPRFGNRFFPIGVGETTELDSRVRFECGQVFQECGVDGGCCACGLNLVIRLQLGLS